MGLVGTYLHEKMFPKDDLVSVEQYEVEEYKTADGIFIKRIWLKEKGYACAQHRHTYDHSTLLTTGGVVLYRDNVRVGEYTAPRCIFIERGTDHKFVATVDDTNLYCIHNLHGLGEVSTEGEPDF